MAKKNLLPTLHRETAWLINIFQNSRTVLKFSHCTTHFQHHRPHRHPTLTSASLPTVGVPHPSKEDRIIHLKKKKNTLSAYKKNCANSNPLPISTSLYCRNTEIFFFFKASALWADAFYKSKCPSVRVFVCPCVCVSVHF